MSFRWFLFVMSCATAAAWIAWFFVIHSIDPTQTGTLGFFLFYLTLFVAILGSAVLFGTLIRSWFRPTDMLFRQTQRAFRQGIILSGLFFGTLLLFAHQLFSWWTALLVMLFFILLELLFLSRNKSG